MKEKSCGAVVYKIENDKLFFLLLKHNAGHFSFPKGHMENLESEVDTAIREIKEETGLDVTIDSNFRVVNTYSPKTGVIKDVVYFVGCSFNNDVLVQESEISDAIWSDFESCIKLITHDNDKVILEKAYKYIIDKL